MGGGDPARRLARHACFYRELPPARHGSLDIAQDGGGSAESRTGKIPPTPYGRASRLILVSDDRNVTY